VIGLSIRNFRAFYNSPDNPLRPLTFLVGENSTGKSSFLAALRLAWDVAYGGGKRIDFNEDPFLLGAFDQIAHYRGGRAGRAPNFELGFTTYNPAANDRASPSLPWHYSARFDRSGSHPALVRQAVRTGHTELAILFSDEKTPRFEFRVGEKRVSRSVDQKEFPFPVRISPESPMDWLYALSAVHDLRLRGGEGLVEKTALTRDEVNALIQMLQLARSPSVNRPVAIAPVRSKPQRTYNPVSETPLPEGEHVPMVLAKTYFENKDRWKSLKSALSQFGSESGLFSSLDIKALGHYESEPFQIRVKLGGPAMNLVDVGYGVSQVLPILVDSLLSGRGDLFLMQQPEVHLHPRAQAALGTLFSQLVAEQQKRFVIETHSDYLIDRVRMDIRDRKILKAEDVLILFFERDGIDVSIRAIEIDSNGELISVPLDYRRFFLDEERRLLGG
jgi:putative AbiEii toxin of type IV toxin-antitoxin system